MMVGSSIAWKHRHVQVNACREDVVVMVRHKVGGIDNNPRTWDVVRTGQGEPDGEMDVEDGPRVCVTRSCGVRCDYTVAVASKCCVGRCWFSQAEGQREVTQQKEAAGLASASERAQGGRRAMERDLLLTTGRRSCHS